MTWKQKAITKGFAYWSVQTDRYMDIRIKRLKKDFKCDGIAVYDYLLNEIYRVKGCYLEWDESTAFDVAEYFGLKETTVKEIVNYCCAVGLFSKELLTSERVLTSKSIQERYISWSIKARRTNIIIPEEILIIREELPKLHEETHNLYEDFDKEKKSKETESKEESKEVQALKRKIEAYEKIIKNGNLTGGPPPAPAPPPSQIIPTEEQVKAYFKEKHGTTTMAKKFYDTWDAVDWINKGNPITKWKSMANRFITTYQENEAKYEQREQTSTATGRQPNGSSTGAAILAQSLATDIGRVNYGGENNSEH
ncbi:DUF4373 domain-containing protein [Chitinophaga sp. Hz27]|uniref:DUF4373 domain-containing protein n=1 Tax=Chitinophaga sp. Hz27 TaxID=3347169 RepID=UPI0035DCBE2A